MRTNLRFRFWSFTITSAPFIGFNANPGLVADLFVTGIRHTDTGPRDPHTPAAVDFCH